MKAQKDLKTENNSKSIESDELKGRKLKPEKKEKNQKRSIFSEIEELDDPELQYKPDEDSIQDYLDDDDVDEDDEFDDEAEDGDDDDYEDDDEDNDDDDELDKHRNR